MMSQLFFNFYSQINISYVDYLLVIFLTLTILSIGSLVYLSGVFKQGLKKVSGVIITAGAAGSAYSGGSQIVKDYKAANANKDLNKSSNGSNKSTQPNSSDSKGSESKT
jgi:hypothetical protein